MSLFEKITSLDNVPLFWYGDKSKVSPFTFSYRNTVLRARTVAGKTIESKSLSVGTCSTGDVTIKGSLENRQSFDITLSNIELSNTERQIILCKGPALMGVYTGTLVIYLPVPIIKVCIVSLNGEYIVNGKVVNQKMEILWETDKSLEVGLSGKTVKIKVPEHLPTDMFILIEAFGINVYCGNNVFYSV